MDNLIQQLEQLSPLLQNTTRGLNITGFLLVLSFSLLTSAIAVGLYATFYEGYLTGSQVHRSFLLVGPAVTTLFLAIQFSLPLSLGLLGALSFVRFRTPIKHAEEVGFILLVIASSIGAATFNFALVGILYVIAVVALVAQRFGPRLLRARRRAGLLLVALTDADSMGVQARMSMLLGQSGLRQVALQSVSTDDGFTSYQYRFEANPSTEWPALLDDLRGLAPAAKINVFLDPEHPVR
jgi:hypothetical protein